ncbi:MAG: STAS domain-containing protein [Anaerolineae bacterium]|jgi:anti-sigma B factor antagonist|nr:STAS domain-containing protein [Anaerolineae bacterium]
MANQNGLSDLKRVEYLDVIGRVDGNNALNLVQAVDNALVNGRNQVILDLSGVEYMNSAGLRELVQLFKRIRREGGNLYIANPAERVKNLLELVGLDTVFEIHSSAWFGLPDQPKSNRFALSRQICYCS